MIDPPEHATVITERDKYIWTLGVKAGRATALEAAAKVLMKMASHKGRVVGTGELKAAALTFEETAKELRGLKNPT